MGNSTKQKDSFLSMFANKNKKRSDESISGVNPQQGVSSYSASEPQSNYPNFGGQRGSYNNDQSRLPGVNDNYSNEEEEQEEGQLNIDVYQTEDDIVIKSSISGVKAEDLDIQIQNDMVTIRGNRQPDERIDSEDYYYQECFWGPFSRAVILPVDIDPENVSAELEDGILSIRLPKTEKIKARKIEVIPK